MAKTRKARPVPHRYRRLGNVGAIAVLTAAVSSCSMVEPPAVEDLVGAWVSEFDGGTSTLTLEGNGQLTVTNVPTSVFEGPGEDLAGTADLVGRCEMEILSPADSPFLYCLIEESGPVQEVWDQVLVGGSAASPTLSFVQHQWAEATLFTYVRSADLPKALPHGYAVVDDRVVWALASRHVSTLASTVDALLEGK